MPSLCGWLLGMHSRHQKLARVPISLTISFTVYRRDQRIEFYLIGPLRRSLDCLSVPNCLPREGQQLVQNFGTSFDRQKGGIRSLRHRDNKAYKILVLMS